jgi:serine/tyrosine/threonine adenylyltransferase
MSLPCGLGIAGLRETFPNPERGKSFFYGQDTPIKLVAVVPYNYRKIEEKMTYRTISPKLFAEVSPVPVSSPSMVIFNHDLVTQLSLPIFTQDQWTLILSGNMQYENQSAIAMAYAGHQFGRFTMLGDGRAHLVAELQVKDKLIDLHLKGSGTTPFSRGGDGRAVLGPMLREYLISEAMAALGVPTTRSLGVVSTGEVVYRETPLPGAIVGRIADSHIRVGTFQYAAISGEEGLLQTLADYTIARHYPDLVNIEEKYREFLRAVIRKQALLIAKWMSIGFVHGVMNTDNMALSGQTIDYGPCAFIDTYQPSIVFSSIDRGGRYAYNQQPNIGLWNLTRFAETLISLLAENSEIAIKMAEEDLASFSTIYIDEYYFLMGQKLGISQLELKDRIVVDRLLEIMALEKLDYTNTFQALTRGDSPSQSSEYIEWFELWQRIINNHPHEYRSLMKDVNPVVIPRNHLVQEALDLAEGGNMELYNRILSDLKSPFTAPKETRLLQGGISDEPFVTYCGT